MWTLCWSCNDWCHRRNLLVELGWEKARGILTEATSEGRQTKLCSYFLPLPRRCQEQCSSEEWKRKDSRKNPRLMTSVLQQSQASVLYFLVNTPLAQDPMPPTSKHVFKPNKSWAYEVIFQVCKEVLWQNNLPSESTTCLHGGSENTKEKLENLPLRWENTVQSHFCLCLGPSWSLVTQSSSLSINMYPVPVLAQAEGC